MKDSFGDAQWESGRPPLTPSFPPLSGPRSWSRGRERGDSRVFLWQSDRSRSEEEGRRGQGGDKIKTRPSSERPPPRSLALARRFFFALARVLSNERKRLVDEEEGGGEEVREEVYSDQFGRL